MIYLDNGATTLHKPQAVRAAVNRALLRCANPGRGGYPAAMEAAEAKDKGGNYIRRERSWGSYSRSFDVSDIDTTQIKAGYQNGVLTLNLPKRTETVPSSRTVTID